MTDLLQTNDISFDSDVINSELPVLVEFKAQWCGPCKRLLPVLENFAKHNLNKIKVVSLDIDESPISASKFEIKSVPTLVIFKKGKKIQSKVGLLSQAALEKFVLEAI